MSKTKDQEWFNKEYSKKEEINIIGSKKLKLKRSLKIKDYTNLKCISLKKFELTSLEIINCSQLNKIELSELGKLTRLKIVNCPQLNKIELSELGKLRLEINNCSQLERITNLFKLSKLESLSVIDCPKLTKLDCLSTGLNELEVSDLTELDCSNTSIKELSLNLCPDIKKLNCSNNNKLISLDVSNCSKLESLDCTGSNKLTSLYLGGCPESITVKKASGLAIVREKKPYKNILMVGRTGGGKSTLANVLTGTDDFQESAYAISETKGFKKKEFTSNNTNFRVVDTIGLGDTKLDIKSVLYKIADGILSMPEGISRVLFVVNGRFTAEEIKTFNTIKGSIFKTGILDYVTIVKTKFSNFRNKSECDKDKEKMLNENETIAEIIKSCDYSVIHVDNPPVDITDDDSDYEEQRIVHSSARKKSRQILLKHLEEKCQKENFKLETWKELRDRILRYIKENENSKDLQKKVESDSELEALVGAAELCLIL